ncbi:hypothetical protein Hamer_G009350 [Homarus americanus]|uniref:Uncharacterized protein n=1 Tax=Homarus americanus TaxID=6706 RepID=A0A8J5MJE5_HOMAM|nr:hypothetical protein Hamer_G009350 [Homarus americanus]
MPPKDPEAEKLKKELQDAIAKVQVVVVVVVEIGNGCGMKYIV